MCVIMVASDTRPSAEMVKAAFKTNEAGAGIAWREGDTARWKKGIMDIDEAVDIVAATPMPFVVHFRIPTNGGTSKRLTHPFPVSPNTSLDLEGVTKGSVLFHNGHWSRWEDTIRDAAIKSGVKLPVGKYTDSRGLAWFAGAFGLGMLELIGERVVVFGPHRYEIFGTGWSYVEKVLVSNRLFETRMHWKDTSSSSRDRRGEGWRRTSQDEPDSRLPEAYRGPAHDPGSSQPSDVKEGVVAGGTEVTPTENPFERLDRLFAEGRLSKKAYKRGRKLIRRREKEARKRLLNVALEQMEASPTRH